MAKSAEELRRENELLKEQLSLNKALKQVETERFQTDENLLDNVRENRNIVEDITKALKFQVTEKKALRKASDSIYEVTRNSFRLLKEELGLDKTKDKLLKDQKTITKEILTLESLKGKIKEGDPERQAAINAEIDAQIQSAKKLKKQIAEIAKQSEQIQNNLGVKSFGALSDVFSKIPGLSKFSGPFEEAAEAARKQAIFNKETFGTTKGLSKENLKALKTGKNLTKDKIKELGLEEKLIGKNGKALAGQAAAQKAQALGLTNSISPLKAGFKSLGPVLKKALGPISIVLMVVDAIKFFVGAMFDASKQAAKLERNLGVSGKEAQNIRRRFNFVANDTSKINSDLVNISKTNSFWEKSTNTISLLQKEIITAFEEINAELGTSVDFTSELGVLGADLVRGQALLVKSFGLTAKEAANITRIQLRQGKEQVEFTKAVLGTVEAQNILNNTRIDSALVLKDIANLSADVRATIGDTAEELARNVYQVRRLGFEFTDLQSMQNNLLDFEGSITKELEAELILGRDINLEKARAAALNNDLVGVGKELRNQNIDIKELQKENAIAAQSAAEAMGMTVEQATKAQEAFEDQNKIQEEIIKNKELSNALSARDISTAKFMKMPLEEIRKLTGEIGMEESKLAEILGEKRFEAMKAQDAQTKFNEALEKAKEQFANLIGSGVLDRLVEGLTKFLDSALFRKITGISKEEQEFGRIEAQVRQQQAAGVQIDQELLDAIQATRDDLNNDRQAFERSFFAQAMTAKFTNFDKENKLGEREKLINREFNALEGNSINVQDFTIRTHPKDTLVMAGGTKLNEDSKETNQLLKTLITAVENGGNVYLNNQLVGEISSQQQLNSFRAGS